ncbi:hypothetical protein ACTFIZ_007964 [Dictyostelium cf. discoideum]
MKQFKQVAVLLALASIGFAAHAEDIKLGYAGPLTGAQAQYGKDMQNGIPSTGSTVAQKLVDSGIKGMLGHFNSGTSIPASAVYSRFKTTFRMMTSDTQQGSVLGAYAVKKLHYKNIAIVDDRTSYGLADEFENAAKAAGGKIERREYTNDKAIDFKPILSNLKAANPDMVFYGGAETQSAPLVKQMRELGMKAVLVSGEMSKTDNFLKLAVVSTEGAIVSLAGLPLDKMPGGAAYKARYEKRFGTPVATYSPYAYDGATAIMKAMVAANSSDPAKYLATLAKTSAPGVTTKNLAYDNHGDLKDGSITVYKVVQGKWQPLESLSGSGI